MSTSHDCHGPVDPSVLVLQKDHRSSSILENVSVMIFKF